MRFTLTNTGKRAGAEIPQLYVRDTLSSRTVFEKQLRGFDRVELKPGESKTVSMTLDAREHLWMIGADMKPFVEPGTFELQIGASSQDIRLKTKLEVR